MIILSFKMLRVGLTALCVIFLIKNLILSIKLCVILKCILFKLSIKLNSMLYLKIIIKYPIFLILFIFSKMILYVLRITNIFIIMLNSSSGAKEQEWIGNIEINKKESKLSETPQKIPNILIQQRSPNQLMRTLIKSLISTPQPPVSPYTSKSAQQTLISLLTNKPKCNSFIQQLSETLPDHPPQVCRNYQLLILLLQHLNVSDIEIWKSDKTFHINFNPKQKKEQVDKLNALQDAVKQKEKTMKEVVDYYQAVIANFNSVLQKLVKNKI